MTLTEEARVTHKCGSMTATEAPVLTAWTSLVQNAEAQLYLQDESLLKSYVLDDTCILSYYLIDPSTRLLHVCNCLVFCRSKESWDIRGKDLIKASVRNAKAASGRSLPHVYEDEEEGWKILLEKLPSFRISGLNRIS